MQDRALPPSQGRKASRPARSSQPRGDDTRHRILAAALDVFAAEGYEGTTTRHLADVAQVNLPAIQYYFGSKDGLYRAVVTNLVATMESRIAPAADRVIQTLADQNLPRRQVMALLCLMMDTFVTLVTDQTVPDWKSRAMFFARAEIEPSTALDPLHEWATQRIFQPCALLVGRLLNRPADEEATLLHTIALLGQVIIFCKQKGPHVLGWSEIDAARVRIIQAVIRDHTRAIFRNAKAAP